MPIRLQLSLNSVYKALSRKLVLWYRRNKRHLPWRRTQDAYAIWVSEIMLQQTRVEAVIPYYERFLSRFPNGESLGGASIEEVLAVWQGLGYYERARRIHRAAKSMKRLPTTAGEWREVEGVGRYTANAIASIAFGERVAVADGNVCRVMARLFGLQEYGGALERKAEELSLSMMGSHDSGEWNQAVMELGAAVCSPRAPQCGACPLRSGCFAFSQGRVADFPVKRSARPKVLERHVCVCIVRNGKVGVRKIEGDRWWAEMYEFPRIVLNAGESVKDALSTLRVKTAYHLTAVRHTVTHHRIDLVAYLARSGGPKGLSFRAISELSALPMPSAQRKVATALADALSPSVLASGRTTKRSPGQARGRR